MNDILKDEQFLPAAVSLISNAKNSIYISTFKIEITTKRRGLRLKQLVDILVKKASDGVDVCLLTNKRDNRGHIPDSNAFALRFFKPSKVKVRYLPDDRVCHAKLIIVDNEVAICGSHNLSVKSCHNNFEVSCLIEETQLAALLAIAYQRIWEQGKEA